MKSSCILLLNSSDNFLCDRNEGVPQDCGVHSIVSGFGVVREKKRNGLINALAKPFILLSKVALAGLAGALFMGCTTC